MNTSIPISETPCIYLARLPPSSFVPFTYNSSPNCPSSGATPTYGLASIPIRPLAGPFQQPQSQEPTPRPSAVVSPAARGAAPIAPVPAVGATLPVAPTSLVPSSPAPKASAPIPSATFATARVPSPIQPPKTIEPIEVGTRVITIAGENKGSFVKVIQSSKKREVVHKNENPKTESHGNDWENSTSSDEAVGNLKKDKSHKGKVTSSMPMRAFVSRNVQSINNSILYNSSCTHNDPGVHLDLSSN
ncbi:hypothetical protein CIPAW_02G043000 [Carya illinoinensis]|uniref:Uncharacterized protein n=1 Tax=Carya illinoinensis TaxID=32201 RepID=A0A8T1R9Z0_CARIL|nr:hypothetical protein CIPAW_02G043000 [Carya illinoinensis]